MSQAPGPVDDVTAGLALATCEAARLLTYAAVQDRVSGQDRTGSANTARVGNVAAERAVARALAQQAGPAAFAMGTPADDQLTVSMPVSLTAGTLEVQLDQVARVALALPKD
jgi:hypothetical protein